MRRRWPLWLNPICTEIELVDLHLCVTKMQALSEIQETKLRSVFRNYPQVKAVYIFGSTVSGRRRADSDLDLAIVPGEPGARAAKLDILTDLVREGFENVDLVVLDTDDIVLAYEAMYQNYLVYALEDFDRGTQYSNTIRKYLDFLPYLEVQREAYKRRVLNGKA